MTLQTIGWQCHQPDSETSMHIPQLVLASLVIATLGTAEQPLTSTQFNAERLDFVVGAHRAFLIRPTRPASDGSKPWLWYAPSFIGQYPDSSHEWMFKQFLAKGFAIGGVDVGESCGNPAGRAAFTAYHAAVVGTYGLLPKVCLLAQSRGGLMLFNWASEHPDLVQCIGGIYTVCDLASFPGLGNAGAAYGFTTADWETHLTEHNPIDRLAPLAKAKIPILILHGDSDRLVPLERNSAVLVSRYRELKGPGELVVTPGKGHQVCDEFFKSQRLVDFLLAGGSGR